MEYEYPEKLEVSQKAEPYAWRIDIVWMLAYEKPCYKNLDNKERGPRRFLSDVDVGWERSEPISITVKHLLPTSRLWQLTWKTKGGTNAKRFRLTETIYMNLNRFAEEKMLQAKRRSKWALAHFNIQYK